MTMELKVWREGQPVPLKTGLAQLDRYLSGLGLDTGWLVIFDLRSDIGPIPERTTPEFAVTPNNRSVAVIRG